MLQSTGATTCTLKFIFLAQQMEMIQLVTVLKPWAFLPLLYPVHVSDNPFFQHFI